MNEEPVIKTLYVIQMAIVNHAQAVLSGTIPEMGQREVHVMKNLYATQMASVSRAVQWRAPREMELAKVPVKQKAKYALGMVHAEFLVRISIKQKEKKSNIPL